MIAPARIAFWTIVVPALIASASAQRPEKPSAQCIATLKPDTVSVTALPTPISYALSEPIGKVASITTDEASKLKVAAFNADENTLQLETAMAVPGDWKLVFKAENDRACDGRVHVRAYRK
jgi:hypothetical protein